MEAKVFRQKLKPWVLPLAMIFGALFHSAIDALQFLVPYLIFTMLFITFCRIRPSELRLTKMIWRLLAVQILFPIALFAVLRPLGLPVAQAAFVCLFCPTATAAPVVTGMLGGSIAKVAAYSIASNLCVAVLAPFLFVWVGAGQAEMSFFAEFAAIALKVAPLILLPLLSAFALYFFARPVHDAVDRYQGVSFYLWAVSLLLVVGKSVSFILREPVSMFPVMLSIALLAGVLCVFQFYCGRRIGKSCGDCRNRRPPGERRLCRRGQTGEGSTAAQEILSPAHCAFHRKEYWSGTECQMRLDGRYERESMPIPIKHHIIPILPHRSAEKIGAKA